MTTEPIGFTSMPKLTLSWDYQILAATKDVLLVEIQKDDVKKEYVAYYYNAEGVCWNGVYCSERDAAERSFLRRAFRVDIKEPDSYEATGGLTCYYCGSDDIATTGMAEFEELEVTQGVECEACGKSWKDVYRLQEVYTDG